MALRISSQMPNSSNVFKLYMDKCVYADSGCKGTKNLSKREERNWFIISSDKILSNKRAQNKEKLDLFVMLSESTL